MSENQLYHGIISGDRRRSFDEVNARVATIAGGLQALGVRPGDCVCVLMRNDIAFMEAVYGVMTLGAYAVPVNWHFKPEEVGYIIGDSATRVLIGHADLLHSVASAIPADLTVLSVPTPPEVIANYKIAPDHLSPPNNAIDFDGWLAQRSRMTVRRSRSRRT